MTGEGSGHDDVSFETTDIHALPVFWFTVALFALIAVVAVSTFFLQRYFHALALEHDRLAARAVSADRPLEAAEIASTFPEPRLQVDAYGDLARLRAEEKALLQQWAIVDPERGIARIPLEEAMTLVAERGIPVWKPVTEPGTGEVRP